MVISQKEFTFLMALLMSVIAISIDALLPALGAIGTDFGINNVNHVQYTIGFIFSGMAIGQLICGPLSDAMGRKPIIYIGLVFYLIGSVICLTAQDFTVFLAGRFIQGLGVSSPYVSTMSIVRDKYSGNEMGRIMSIIMMIFIMVPAIAPSLGQAILLWSSWRAVFVLYIVYSIIVIAWTSLRLDETLPREKRIPFHVKNLAAGFREVVSSRITMNYMVCIGIIFGSFVGYLNSSQQIFQVQFNTGKMFTVYFGLLALLFGVSSLLNSRLVNRLGMRAICARSMQAVIVISAAFLAVHFVVEVKLWMFLIYAGSLFFCMGLMFGNLNAIAMEPMEHVAGIASAVIGFASSLISMTLGALIGQLYNNTLIPVVSGFLILNVIAYLIMLNAERGKKTTA